MIGRQRIGILSTNHMRAFRHSFSKAETRFKGTGFCAFECEIRHTFKFCFKYQVAAGHGGGDGPQAAACGGPGHQGEAVQVDTINIRLKAPGTKRSKL